jgi:hypothetical protein
MRKTNKSNLNDSKQQLITRTNTTSKESVNAQQLIESNKNTKLLVKYASISINHACKRDLKPVTWRSACGSNRGDEENEPAKCFAAVSAFDTATAST